MAGHPQDEFESTTENAARPMKKDRAKNYHRWSRRNSIFVGLAIGLGIIGAIELPTLIVWATGADALAGPLHVVRLTVFVSPIAFLLITFASRIFRWWSVRSTGRDVIFGLSLFNRGHQWLPMRQDEAAKAWVKMGQYPEGGSLESAWSCSNCDTLYLESADRDGRHYDLFTDFEKGVWLDWVVGLFVLSYASSPGTDSVVRLRLFYRECRWIDAGPDATAAELARLGQSDTVSPVRVWVCLHCSEVRIDCLDGAGQDVLIVTNRTRPIEWRWMAGLYFVHNTAPTLPSDTLRQ